MPQYPKNQFIPLIPSLDTVKFRFLRPEWLHPFLTMFTRNNFHLTFNFHKPVSTYKIAILSFCSGDIVDLEILQSNWSRAFWPLRNQIFPKHGICAKTANNIKFHYRPYFKKLKKKKKKKRKRKEKKIFQ